MLFPPDTIGRVPSALRFSKMYRQKEAPTNECWGFRRTASTYSSTYYRSTIGAERLNFRVRDGIGWTLSLWTPNVLWEVRGQKTDYRLSIPVCNGVTTHEYLKWRRCEGYFSHFWPLCSNIWLHIINMTKGKHSSNCTLEKHSGD